MNRLNEKKVIITGANRGFGEILARTFIEEGAFVMLCAREEHALKSVADSLNAGQGRGKTLWMKADVSLPEEAAAVVDRAKREWDRLDVLINNAGVYGPMGKFHEIDFREWVRAVEINLFGSALMCKLVLPLFLEGGGGRIIQMSGGGATKPLPNISAYAASKAGIVRLVETIAAEYSEHNIFINAIAPGALNTRLLDEVLAAGPERVGPDFHKKAVEQKRTGGTPMKRAAALAVFLASEQARGITGRLISALWDPWERFPELREPIMQGDIYTLRRIVPEDRGMKWND